MMLYMVGLAPGLIFLATIASACWAASLGTRLALHQLRWTRLDRAAATVTSANAVIVVAQLIGAG